MTYVCVSRCGVNEDYAVSMSLQSLGRFVANKACELYIIWVFTDDVDRTRLDVCHVSTYQPRVGSEINPRLFSKTHKHIHIHRVWV